MPPDAETTGAAIVPPDRRSRRFAVALIVALAAMFLAVPGDRPAAATAGDEAAFAAGLNDVRAGVGLGPLTVNAELATLARQHAQVMADAEEIFHADPISAGFSGSWQKMGENVGVGANVQVLVDAFVSSPGHYANIIDPAFSEVGVGVVWHESALYTTHRFLQPGAVPPASTTTSAPPTTTSEEPPPTTPTTSTPPPDDEPPPDGPAEPPPDPPAISPARVEALLELLELVGT